VRWPSLWNKLIIIIKIPRTIFIVHSIWRQPYARVHIGSPGRKSVSIRWLLTHRHRPGCKLDVWLRLLAAIDRTFANRHLYYYSTIRLILIYRRPRHCSQCAAFAQSCVLRWFSWKHKLLPATRFVPGSSRAAGKHATIRPLWPVTIACKLLVPIYTFSKINKYSSVSSTGSRLPEVSYDGLAHGTTDECTHGQNVVMTGNQFSFFFWNWKLSLRLGLGLCASL